MNWTGRRPCRKGLWRQGRRIGRCGGRLGFRGLWGGIGGTLAVYVGWYMACRVDLGEDGDAK